MSTTLKIHRSATGMFLFGLLSLVSLLTLSASPAVGSTAPCGGAPPQIAPGPGPVSSTGITTDAGDQAITIPLGYDKAENDADVTFTAKDHLPPLSIGVHTNSRGLNGRTAKAASPLTPSDLVRRFRATN
jgi:hypothetical protein